MRYLCFMVAIVVMMSACSCFAEEPQKYLLTREQQQYILQKLSNTDIKGAEAPMLLSVAQALQKPVVEKVETPKVEIPQAETLEKVQ